MIHIILLVLWFACSILVIHERKFLRTIIYLSIFSLITSLCFLSFGAPDVAMAEAVAGVFSTIILIVAFEKFYKYIKAAVKSGERAVKAAHIEYDGSLEFDEECLQDDIKPSAEKKTGIKKNIFRKIKKHAPSAIFAIALFILFVMFIPDKPVNPYLKEQYLAMFSHDIGGRNAVTAIYLGYRLYDTLFEALLLFVSIVAIVHLSWYNDDSVFLGQRIEVYRSQIIGTIVRIISPIMLITGFIIITNGHLSPGGGFQGGIIIASFFICRYLLYDTYDISIRKLLILEKIFFIGIVVLAALFITSAVDVILPEDKSLYLIMMNLLIGMKVVCGFVIIFYRFIVFERW